MMNHNHEHSHEHCSHESLKYCPICDVVYCFCGKEWRYNFSTYTWTNLPITIGASTYPYASTSNLGCIHRKVEK